MPCSWSPPDCLGNEKAAWPQQGAKQCCACPGLAGDALSALDSQSSELVALRRQLQESQQLQADSQVVSPTLAHRPACAAGFRAAFMTQPALQLAYRKCNNAGSAQVAAVLSTAECAVAHA